MSYMDLRCRHEAHKGKGFNAFYTFGFWHRWIWKHAPDGVWP